jgi:hypothetical protein
MDRDHFVQRLVFPPFGGGLLEAQFSFGHGFLADADPSGEIETEQVNPNNEN